MIQNFCCHHVCITASACWNWKNWCHYYLNCQPACGVTDRAQDLFFWWYKLHMFATKYPRIGFFWSMCMFQYDNTFYIFVSMQMILHYMCKGLSLPPGGCHFIVFNKHSSSQLFRYKCDSFWEKNKGLNRCEWLCEALLFTVEVLS